MHWTQALYIGLLCVALAASWRQPWSALIAAVMVGNLAATMAISGAIIGPAQFLAVGIADMVCAAFLIRGNMRARVIATLFSVMIPVYVSARFFHWHDATTYTIIDIIAYAQLGVIGGLGGGLRSFCRAIGRGRADASGAAPSRHIAAIRDTMDQGQAGRVM